MYIHSINSWLTVDCMIAIKYWKVHDVGTLLDVLEEANINCKYRYQINNTDRSQ